MLVDDLPGLAEGGVDCVLLGAEKIGSDEGARPRLAIDLLFDDAAEAILRALPLWCGLDQTVGIGLRLAGSCLRLFRRNTGQAEQF